MPEPAKNKRPEGSPIGPEVPPEITEALASMRAPIVIAHVTPDADALGSMFAVARAYTGDSCRARVSLPEGSLSQKLAFMSDWAGVACASPAGFESADGFIVLDTAKKPRCLVRPELSSVDWASGRTIVNIDHHATNTRFGQVNWVVDDAGSTSELVFHMLTAAFKSIDAVTASLLFAGILTDTAGFSLPTTSASALRTAAALVDLGADVGDLGERLCRSVSRSEFDLLRIIYDNTTTADDGRIAYSTANYDEIHGAGCCASDIDDQIAVPRSRDGCVLSMLFTEGIKGKTRINFRGSGSLEVVSLAAQFNGGGHSQAAGAIQDGSVDEVVKRVLPAAIRHLAGS